MRARLDAVWIAIALVGCAAPVTPETAPDTSTGGPTHTTAPTLLPAPTRVPTSIPTPHPTPEQPAVITDDFLFDGFRGNCAPPCWNGLMVGKSHNEDIVHTLGDGFDFSPEHYSEADDPIMLEGHSSKVYQWFAGPHTSQNLALTVVVSKPDQTLAGLSFSWIDSRYDRYLYPQRLLRELGAPSQMEVDFEGTGNIYLATFKVLMVYESGIFLFTETQVPVTISPSNNSDQRAMACLGGSRWSNPEILKTGASLRALVIVDPFVTGAADLSAMQDWAYSQLPVQRGGLIPAERVFSMSMQDILGAAMQQGDACLQATVP